MELIDQILSKEKSLVIKTFKSCYNEFSTVIDINNLSNSILNIDKLQHKSILKYLCYYFYITFYKNLNILKNPFIDYFYDQVLYNEKSTQIEKNIVYTLLFNKKRLDTIILNDLDNHMNINIDNNKVNELYQKIKLFNKDHLNKLSYKKRNKRRLKIPITNINEDELKWINISNNPDFIYDIDSIMSLNDKSYDLIQLAKTKTLNTNENTQILKLIEKNSNCILISDISDIIDNNPLIATKILIKIEKKLIFKDYQQIFCTNKVSLRILEVVNQLIRLNYSFILDNQQFIALFMNHCIHSCYDISDQYLQARLVRVVALFFTNIYIKYNDWIINNPIKLQIIKFCQKYQHIKDVKQLYQKYLDKP